MVCFFALFRNSAWFTGCCGDPPHVPGNDAVDSSRGYNADISHAASERLATLLFGWHLRKQQRVPEWATAEERIARNGGPPRPPFLKKDASDEKTWGADVWGSAARRCWELRGSPGNAGFSCCCCCSQGSEAELSEGQEVSADILRPHVPNPYFFSFDLMSPSLGQSKGQLITPAPLSFRFLFQSKFR